MELVVLVGIGLLAGVVSAICGVGGGVVVVPALLWIKGMDVKLAVGTSLAYIVPTAIMGVWRKMPLAQVDLKTAGILAVGGIVGAVLGAWAADVLPGAWIKRGFAVLLVITAIQLVWES